MFPNLKAEMARKGITIGMVAEFLNVRPATVSDKINGKFRFYYEEVIAIRNKFFPDLSIEYLFENEENKTA